MSGRYDTSYSPFPVGESPFRAKGVLFRGTQEFFEENVRGGLGTLLQQLGEGPLAAFISQKFLPASTYDALTIPALIRAEADACGLSLPLYMHKRTRWQAERDMNGVYRLLLKVTSAETIVVRLPRVLSQMFNFPQPVTEVSDSVSLTQLKGVPDVLAAYFEMAVGTYAPALLELAGAKKAKAELVGVTPAGVQHGLRIVDLQFRASWT
ncbi:MAG: hypothetical protein ACXWUG_03660 [Polyangiales bacterium]